MSRLFLLLFRHVPSPFSSFTSPREDDVWKTRRRAHDNDDDDEEGKQREAKKKGEKGNQ